MVSMTFDTDDEDGSYRKSYRLFIPPEPKEIRRPAGLEEPGEDDYLLSDEDHTGEDVD